MSVIQSLYSEEQEYKIGGATYIVSAEFKHTGRKEDNTSFPTCVKKIINGSYASRAHRPHRRLRKGRRQQDLHSACCNLLSFCRLFGITRNRRRKLHRQYPQRRRRGVYPHSEIRIRQKVSRHNNLLTTYKPDEIE